MPKNVEVFPEQKKRRGPKLPRPPANAPLGARKMWELLDYFDLSAEQLSEEIGLESGNTIRACVKGAREVESWVRKLVAHARDIPESWWDDRNAPIATVAGKGLGKAKLESSTLTIPRFTKHIATLKDAINAFEQDVQAVARERRSTK